MRADLLGQAFFDEASDVLVDFQADVFRLEQGPRDALPSAVWRPGWTTACPSR
jgi:hypothetical protein